jgi:hypothetical protein
MPAGDPAAAGIAILPPGAAPAGARWLLAAGAAPPDTAALLAALAEAPPDAAIIRGHHLRRAPDGTEALHRTADPAAAWARLLAGDVGAEGPSGFGAPEATLIRADALARLGGELPRDTPALAALLRRAPQAGVALHDADAVLGLDAPRDDRAAWRALVAAQAGAQAAQALDAAWDAALAAAAARTAAAAPARRALALVAALDGVSPPLGRALEGVLLGGAVRRLRAMLRR